VFSDGLKVGATLDRNGLRPARYIITRDGYIVVASEAGGGPEADIVKKADSTRADDCCGFGNPRGAEELRLSSALPKRNHTVSGLLSTVSNY